MGIWLESRLYHFLDCGHICYAVRNLWVNNERHQCGDHNAGCLSHFGLEFGSGGRIFYHCYDEQHHDDHHHPTSSSQHGGHDNLLPHGPTLVQAKRSRLWAQFHSSALGLPRLPSRSANRPAIPGPSLSHSRLAHISSSNISEFLAAALLRGKMALIASIPHRVQAPPLRCTGRLGLRQAAPVRSPQPVLWPVLLRPLPRRSHLHLPPPLRRAARRRQPPTRHHQLRSALRS
ncbi:hypothetical protein R3P38DRAFT_689463 [Favolaschia claudopus]|uniref:Uncharacterized protein n=1 Tax=Favolaschia claudopus TaxID=2862362 RepID=A0AAW0EDB8_9AGAR